MPPAWSRHQRYWLAWPAAAGPWRDHLDAAREAMAALAAVLSEHRPVTVLANPEELADVSLMCGPGVAAMVAAHGECCLGAIGPGFLVRPGEARLGGIVWPGEGADAAVAAAILENRRAQAFPGPLPRAGAMIEVDGEGTALVSEALLAGRSAAEVAALLRDWLGVEQVIWLNGAIDGDTSGGRLFNAARFLRPGVAVCSVESDAAAPDAAMLADNLKRLERAFDAGGRRIEVVPVPLPKPVVRPDGSRVAMSYANCFVDGSLVVLPAFEDSRDEMAYDLVVQALLDHTVVAHPAAEFAFGGAGGLGSLILAEPAAPEAD